MATAVETVTITAECGAKLREGDRAYNYYDRKPGVIARPTDAWGTGTDVWFDFHHDDGTRALLNGQRICSMQFARLRGFRNADPR